MNLYLTFLCDKEIRNGVIFLFIDFSPTQTCSDIVSDTIETIEDYMEIINVKNTQVTKGQRANLFLSTLRRD